MTGKMSQDEFNERAKMAVMTYNSRECVKVAKEAIASGADLAELVQKGYSMGINEIGDLFQAKKLYLTHIMEAAKAMNAGMNIITPEMERTGNVVRGSLGTFVICTIEGDIHSIGKDIVAMMMEVAGFRVINLGRDVPVGKILEAVRQYSPTAIGTSAMMTSTMENQRTLEAELAKEGLRDKVITNIGGAPTSQRWCDEIGADFHSRSASDCVFKMGGIVGRRSPCPETGNGN